MKLDCMKRLFSLGMCCAVIALIGCGPSAPPSGTVSGSVTLEGQAVDAGEITFVSSDGFSASAPITGGQFKIEEALPVGKYAVGITPPSLTEAPGEGGDNVAAPQSDVPAGYNLPSSSGLTHDVQEGASTMTIELKKDGPA